MHFCYRSTSFCIPSEKKRFSCSKSHVCTPGLFESPANTFYGIRSHHALRFVQINSWFRLLPPLVLTWLVGLPRPRNLASGYIRPCTMLNSDQLGFGPLHLFFLRSTNFVDSSCVLHTPPTSGDGRVWLRRPAVSAQRCIGRQLCNRWV